MAHNIDDLQCAIEERAAIMEYDAGLPRAKAEKLAAQCHGFADWRAWKQYKREVMNGKA